MDDWIDPDQLLWEVGSEEALVKALEHRLELGQALGILMERHHVDHDGAMQMLAERAVAPGSTLRQAARTVVEECLDASAVLDPHG